MAASFRTLKRSSRRLMRIGRSLHRAFRLVLRAAPGWTFASFPLFIAQGVLPLASLYLIKLILDAVEGGVAGGDAAEVFPEIELFIILAAAVALLTGFCNLLGNLFQEAQAQAVTDHVYDMLHRKSISIDLAYYEDSRYYDTLHRAQREAPHLPARMVGRLAHAARSSISLAALGSLLVAFHPGLAAAVFIAAAPRIYIRLRHSDRLYRWTRKKTPTERKAWYYHWLLAWGENAKDLRVYQLGKIFAARFAKLRETLRDERIALSSHHARFELIAQTLTTLTIFSAFAFVAYRTLQGVYSLGDFVLFYQAAQKIQGALRETLSAGAGLYDDHLFLANLYEFLNLEPRVIEPQEPETVPVLRKAGLVVEGLSFAYPGTAEKALQDIDLQIRPGEVVALVGANGSGKTTLVKLLCRLYDPDGGRILWEGVDLRAMRGRELRREIGVLFQDFGRFHLSARENIWVGDTRLDPNDERIAQAAEAAGVRALIEDLPGGWETILGQRFDEGRELSLGEWQKVALARVFLGSSQIVLLDEPTSALDAQSERRVLEDFRKLSAGRSTLLISHRMSTVRMADRIYVLDGGRIVEEGDHESLLAIQGVYARFFEIQASNYGTFSTESNDAASSDLISRINDPSGPV